MIYIVSLSLHRIDEMLADMAFLALSHVLPMHKLSRGLPDNNALAIDDTMVVFNGVFDIASENCMMVSNIMAAYPHQCYYFIDDITTYVPRNPGINIVSQFEDIHPLFPDIGGEHWTISKLASLLPDLMGNIAKPPFEYDFVYWGHFKEERIEGYKEHIPNHETTLIIGDEDKYRAIGFDKCTYMPYMRDMQELYATLSKCCRTAIILDKYHENNSVPWRVYEATYCGLMMESYPPFKILSAEELGKELINILYLDDPSEDKLTYTSMEDKLNGLCCGNPSNVNTEGKLHGTGIDDPGNIMEGVSVPEEFLSGYKQVNTQADHHTSDTTEVLTQRAKIYGSYIGGVDCRAHILSALNAKYEETHSGNSMPFNLLVMMSDQVLKLMRIASDPTHLDSFIDNEGYARLIKEAKERGEF